uniref:Putative tick kunitz 1 n=1 Tax=Amblyomma americanum TaxID=6943 RepID=A0A0C9RX89_AMBAM
MQLLTIFALLCLLGPTLSAHALKERCRKPVASATRTCPKGETHTLRFTYYPGTGKCGQYWHSGCYRGRNRNSFHNFTECMKECNPTSICLKTPTQHRGLIPRVTSFVFDINTLNCTEKKSFRTPDVGPQYNRFFQKDVCKNTCEPDLVEIIRSSG